MTLPAAKRRWRAFVIAAVLGLVLLSMLVPLAFLLGLHNSFRSATAYATEKQSSASNGLEVYNQHKGSNSANQSKGDQSTHAEDLIKRLIPTLPKDFDTSALKEVENKTTGKVAGLPVPIGVPKPDRGVNSTRIGGAAEVSGNKKGVSEESENFCEVKFGSYCLWRQDHKEEMKDYMVKKLKDRLYVARAYYPSIAKLPARNKLSQELKQNIQEFERVLSETSTDADLPQRMGKRLEKMEVVIARAKSIVLDCNNVDKKLRQLVDLTEDEANFHMKQSAFLYQLAVQTVPKSLHCLSMRLAVEYFKSPPPDAEQSMAEKYMNPSLQHFVIFSNNILASSVVINSTVMHTRDKETPSHLSLSEEFRVSFHSGENPSRTYTRTQYMSVFSHSHYLLPKIFHALEKLVVLDDDIVVQRDLSALWSLDLEGKVNGALQFCEVRLAQLKNYLGENISDGNSCAWMSGVNIVDLARWRQLDLTGTFHRLLQEHLNRGEESFQAASVRATLLAFQDLVHPLDDTWMLSGLGHDYGLNIEAVKKAGVLHFNGNMKPWIDMGIPKYRGYWKRFLIRENQFLSDCNVNP